MMATVRLPAPAPAPAGPGPGPGEGQCGRIITGTSHAIGSATPGRRSAGQGKSQGSSGLPGRVRGQSTGSLARVSALETALAPSSPLLQRHRSIRDSAETAEATQNVTEKQAPNPPKPATITGTSPTAGTSTATTTATTTAASAKTRLPVSSTAAITISSVVPSSPDLDSLSPSSPLLHRQPRTYSRSRASSSLAAPAAPPQRAASSRPPSQASASASASASAISVRRSRRPSDDSAISFDDHSSSPPPGSSPPSSVGRDLQASSPFAEPKPAFSSSPPRPHHHRHRRRASSFHLPSAAPSRPRAYSDQGPRPDVSRPPQTFFLRRSSNPELPVGPDSRLSASSSHPSLLSRSVREPASFSAKGVSTSSGPPPSINVRLLDSSAHDASFAALHQHHQQHYQHHQPRLITASRQLLPLKTAARSSPPDERRHRSLQRSYRLSLTGSLPANTSPIRVPPIRSFRSSGSRKSIHSSDMNLTPHPYHLGESAGAPLYDEDPATAAAASPYDGQSRLRTPPAPGRHGASGEESGDVFLRLAREDAVNRGANARTPDGTYSPVSATHRSWHRRPLSTNLTSHHQLSPPKLRRRLSDQQERPFLGNLEDDQSSQASRVLQYRSMVREKAASAHPGEMVASQFTPSPRTHRPPPVSSRSPVYHDNSDSYRHTRRRSSVTESTPPLSSRGQQNKAGTVHNFSKMYNSSPLVRSVDLSPPQPAHESQNGVEGTESTGSTTAPSTVWDELDELKSRINRLEITGKIPPTSGATVSKMDERPVTAGTTVTTASTSPKRQVNVHADDTASVSTPTTNAYPLLQTALANCKLNLSSQVYQALDCLAQDALGLSAAMGQGPMPSGASTVGSGSAVTDRQLRRKAESVCRSLTELCITLNDDAHRASTSQYQAQAFAPGTPLTPTIPKSHSSGLPIVRRSSIVDGNMSHTSPRVLSKFEERRNSLLHGSGPPVSLHSTPNSLMSNDGRHSSLFVSRTRQIRQEDPEDGRESVLSRTRRAMTEEPEDGRRSSFLVRSRRGTAEDMDQPLSRSPTRRTVTMAYQPTNEHALEVDTPDRYETSSVVSSVAPRRRFIPELHTSRLAGPAGSSPAPTRKYLERTVSTREGAGTPIMERLSRHVSLHSRTGSLSRTNRDSMLPRPPTGNATPEGPQ